MKDINKLFTGRRGVTLTELLVAISLIAVVAFPAGLMLINNARLYEYGREKIELQGTAQIAMNGVYNMLLSAEGIYPLDIGSFDTNGFAEVRRLRVMQSGDTEDIIEVSNGRLAINDKPQAENILLEAKPAAGNFNDCKGLNLKITAYRSDRNDADTARCTLVNLVYFRNGE